MGVVGMNKKKLAALLLTGSMLLQSGAALAVEIDTNTEINEDVVEDSTQTITVNDSTTVSSGSCGDNLTWTLDDEGTLRIAGTGAMTDDTMQTQWEDAVITRIVIEDGVTSIGKNAFSGCSTLTSVDMADSVTSMGTNAFYGCTSLSNVRLSQNLTSIAESAFFECSSLKSVTIPDSVTIIDKSAFNSCSSLESVQLGSSVKKIREYAFLYCESLTSIIIPESVTIIGSSAFYACTSLTEIEVASENQKFSSIEGVLYNKDQTKLIQYPIGNSRTSFAIPDGVTDIGNESFARCSHLISVAIPASVTNVGDSVFSDNTGLESIAFKGNLPSVDDTAFYRIEITIYYPSTWEEVPSETAYAAKKITWIPIQAVTGIAGDQTDNVQLTEGEQTQISCHVLPEDATNQQIIWTSSDESIAKVDQDGVVTGISAGSADIAATTAEGDFKYAVTITVNKPHTHTYDAPQFQWSDAENCTAVFTCQEEDSTETVVCSIAVNREDPSCTEDGKTVYTATAIWDGTAFSNTKTETIQATGHKWDSGKVTESAACTKNGSKTYTCENCGKIRTESTAKTTHSYQTTVTKAKPNENGSIAEICTVCGDCKSKTILYAPKTITLSANSCIYNGAVQKPTVTVKDSNGTVIPESNYTVSYSSEMKNIGTYTVTAELKSNKYSGSLNTSFQIYAKNIADLSAVLAKTSDTYSGSACKPTVTLQNGSTKLKSGTDYTVAYTNNKRVGKASVILTGKGNYTGTKELTFAINPKSTALKSVTASSKGFTAKWTKQTSQTTGYQIQYAATSKFTNPKTVTIAKNTTVSKKITKLTAKKKYYVRIRTYKTVNGTKYCSAWSKAKTVTTKK
jgi:hypothetical protein